MIVKYLNRLIAIKPAVNGLDLKSMGICEGVLCGKILNDVLMLKMDGRLKTRKDEIEYIKSNYI